ncbi:hypothetical protein [Leptolyngbya sp. KIOST-1]|uniref:hypothetical protein n=1 Tax=Leptolyngbya sp. KIOST-1 TaxID=1229172 RepID=UPI0012E0A207|nr:hypothetical protein [Leptolyngbya sp. KIOST-1]
MASLLYQWGVGLTAGRAIAPRAEGALVDVGEGAIVRCTRYAIAPTQSAEVA